MAASSRPHCLAQGWPSSGQTSPRAQRAARYPLGAGFGPCLAFSFLGPGRCLSVVTSLLIPRKCRFHRARPADIHVLGTLAALGPQGPPARVRAHGPEKGSGEVRVTAAGQGPRYCRSLPVPAGSPRNTAGALRATRGERQDSGPGPPRRLRGLGKGTSGCVLVGGVGRAGEAGLPPGLRSSSGRGPVPARGAGFRSERGR